MKFYIFIDHNKAYTTFGRSVAEARQRVADEFDTDVSDLPRVEVSPKAPKMVEWAKLSNVSEVKNEATFKAKKAEVEPAE